MKFFPNGNSNCCLKCDREINSFINIIYFLYIFSYIHVEGKIAHLKVLKCFLSHYKIFQHYYVRCLALLYKCFSGIHVERISVSSVLNIENTSLEMLAQLYYDLFLLQLNYILFVRGLKHILTFLYFVV